MISLPEIVLLLNFTGYKAHKLSSYIIWTKATSGSPSSATMPLAGQVYS